MLSGAAGDATVLDMFPNTYSDDDDDDDAGADGDEDGTAGALPSEDHHGPVLDPATGADDVMLISMRCVCEVCIAHRSNNEPVMIPEDVHERYIPITDPMKTTKN